MYFLAEEMSYLFQKTMTVHNNMLQASSDYTNVLFEIDSGMTFAYRKQS